MNAPHFMIDIETLGSDPATTPVLVIGACTFNPSGNTVDESSALQLYVTEEMYADWHPRKADPSTVAWWRKQPQEARDALTSGTACASVPEMCREFVHWCEQRGNVWNKSRVWAKPPNFDIAILTSLFKQAGIRWPFSWGKERDVRTVVEIGEMLGVPETKPIIKHRADHDAIAQARTVLDVLGTIKR